MLKDRRGFTGLEAAIVLIAFVVVAAVFSYVVLNAGFFTTQKSQEVVHTGVQKAAQSIELAGDVIGYGNTTINKLIKITFTLQCTAGASPVDLNKTIITYTDEDDYNASMSFTYTEITGDGDNLIEPYEKFEITVPLVDENSWDATNNTFTVTYIDTLPGPNDEFQLEIKPPGGAVLPIKRTVPPNIDEVMRLY